MADEPRTPPTDATVALLRRAFGPLDPALDPARMPSAAQRRAHTERLLAEYRTLAARRSPRRRHSRRRLLAMTGAVATAAAGGVVAVLAVDQRRPSPVYAATPALLPVTGRPAPGADRLRELAAAAAAAPRPAAGGGGPVEHLLIERWSLDSAIDDIAVSSAVIPSRREVWRAPRGSAVTVDSYLPPQFPAGGDPDAWERLGRPGAGPPVRTGYGPGEFPSAFPGSLPGEPGALAALLRGGDQGPAAVVRAAAELLRERVLSGGERAVLLRALGTQPGIRHQGRTVDRAGRPGDALEITSDDSGGTITDRLVVDEATGAVLAHEQILTDGAAALPVPRPAVIGYTTFRTAEHVAALPG